MCTCFFKASRRASFLQAPDFGEGLDPLLKALSNLIRLTLPFDLNRLLSLMVSLLRPSLRLQNPSIFAKYIAQSQEWSHHHSHILLARSKLLVMPTLKRRKSYKGGGHWGHLRILPASLGKHQLSTDQYYRMAERKVVHSSIRPKDKADLSRIQDRLASWSMPFTCGCHLPAAVRCRHSSPDVLFLLDSSVIKPSLEMKSNFDDYYTV